MKRTLGIGTGRLSKRKPRVSGIVFKRRKRKAKKRRPGIWYMILPDGSKLSTRERLTNHAEAAAFLFIAAKENPACETPPEHYLQLDLI